MSVAVARRPDGGEGDGHGRGRAEHVPRVPAHHTVPTSRVGYWDRGNLTSIGDPVSVVSVFLSEGFADV